MSIEPPNYSEARSLADHIRRSISNIPHAHGICIIPGQQEPYFVISDDKGDLHYVDISLLIEDPTVLRRVAAMCWQLRELFPDLPDILGDEVAYAEFERELRDQYGVEFCGINGIRVLPV